MERIWGSDRGIGGRPAGACCCGGGNCCAILLANGSSLLEAAESMGVTEATVRTYSKRILGKTGVRRQSELVRLVLKSVVQLAETEG